MVQETDAAASWTPPAVEASPGSGPWGWALSWAFDPSAQYVWGDTFGDLSLTNSEETYALYRSLSPLRTPTDGTTIEGLPPTTYLRSRFTLTAEPGDAQLALDCQIEDGAVIYLNGVELARDNLPEGALVPDTLARTDRDGGARLQTILPATSLHRGENVLAAAVYQASPADPGLTFSCSLQIRTETPTGFATAHISEWGPGEAAWLEIEALLEVDSDALVLRSTAGLETSLGHERLAAGDLLFVDGLGPIEPGELVWIAHRDTGQILDTVRVANEVRARATPLGPALSPAIATPGAPNVIPLSDTIVINEIMYHRNPRNEADLPFDTRPEEWIELTNRGDTAVDLAGWRLVDAVAFTFPAGTELAPGEFLVVARDAASLQSGHPEAAIIGDWEGSLSNSSDHIVLLDARGNPADMVRYVDGGRWPAAGDGGGSSLELIDVWADNSAPGAWAASDESERAPWTTITWAAEASPSAAGPDGVWNEFVMGLLDAGEVQVDDLSVLEDPDGERFELIRDGGFDGDGDWRLIGNHHQSGRISDPDEPSNPVLHLVATGPTEHMHNHAETTLDRPLRGIETQISFRARWVSGSNQLHTRLYFNRMPKTHLLPQPDWAGTPGAPNSRAGTLGPTLQGLHTDIAVPLPTETAIITVEAQDPDGVATVDLRWRRDGEAGFSTTPMTETSPGRYEGSLPGQSAGTLVQFYVEALDGEGMQSFAPATGPESRALIRWNQEYASEEVLPRIRLLMMDEDNDWFHNPIQLMSNEGVGATFIYNERDAYFDISVRAKGSQRGRPEPLRLGYGVRFLDDEPFRGVHSSILLDRSEGVNFGQREVLHNIIAARLGLESAEYNDLATLIAPRPEQTGPVELQIDRFGSLMLDAQFEDGADGTQWDYELIYFPLTTDDGNPEGYKLPQPDSVIGVPIGYLGEDKEAYRWNFAIQNNTDRDDYEALIAMTELFSAPDETFVTEVDRVIDTEQWLRAFAFATLSGAVDNYGSDSSQHNARLYLRPSDKKVLFFPHDLDFYGSPMMPLVGNSDLARLLTNPSFHRLYYGALDDALRRAYSSTYLAPWCTQLATLLPDQDFPGHCAFVDARASFLRNEATDAVDTRYPPTDFAVLTGGGGVIETTSSTVTLEGTGGIAVRLIHAPDLGLTFDPEWTTTTTWRLGVPITEGTTTLRLLATDLRGEAVGEAAVVVSRTSP